MGKLAVAETTSTTVSGPFRSAADGKPAVNVNYPDVYKSAARAHDSVEYVTTTRPAVLIS